MLLLNEHGLKDIYPLCVEVIYPKLCNTYVSEHEKMARLNCEILQVLVMLNVGCVWLTFLKAWLFSSSYLDKLGLSYT